MIKIKGINFYPRQVESLLLGETGVGNDYLLEIDRVEGRDSLRITVEVDNPDDRGLVQKLGGIIHDFLGFGADIHPVPLGGIEKPQGKAVRVLDRREGLVIGHQ
jgi:phenylacetate-CoA ligase